MKCGTLNIGDLFKIKKSMPYYPKSQIITNLKTNGKELVLASNEEEYKGSLIDLKDGFIHLSSVNQIYETCKKHFFGRENLIVIYFKIKGYGRVILQKILEIESVLF